MIDLSYLNECLVIDSFNMEMTASIMTAMKQNDWTMSIDLNDAYFHIPMSHTAMKYLCFVVNGKVYQFSALPFGLATVPLISTRVMSGVAAYAHLKGVRLHIWMTGFSEHHLNFRFSRTQGHAEPMCFPGSDCEFSQVQP